MRALPALTLSVLVMTGCAPQGATNHGYASPLPNVHVTVELETDPSISGGCCRLISSSDAKSWVSAFCQLVVYGPDGKVMLDQRLWPAPAGLAIHPGVRQDAGITTLSLDPVHDRYSVTCQAVEWHGQAPI
jgi:hypothetical protein